MRRRAFFNVYNLSDMTDTSSTHGWSALLIILFLSGVTFLFFFLYLKPPTVPDSPERTRLEPLEEPTITVVNPRQGAANAQVTIVEFGDYQCGACQDLHKVVGTVMAEHPDTIRRVWKDMPNEELHPQATSAAIAARCAEDQGKFWEYHELLFTQSRLLNEATYRAIAQATELNLNTFDRCFQSQDPLPRIQHDFEEGIRLSLTATPTIFVNRERYTGSITLEDLREIVQKELDALAPAL